VAEAEPKRLVAVFGYSARGSSDLHALCVLRLRHAEALADGAAAVVLSGWSRHDSGFAEAEHKRDAWQGPDVRLVCDTTARNTMQNALGVAAIARELGVDEVVVVTSQWHAPRAGSLVRAALGDDDITVSTSSPPGLRHPRLVARELVCLAALPYQRRHVRPPRTALDGRRLSADR
jgi:hypothetical protein